MQNDDEIFFGGSDELTPREQFYYKAIVKTRDHYIKNCILCGGSGFVNSKGETAMEVAVGIEVSAACTCRKKAVRAVSFIRSGIPRRHIDVSAAITIDPVSATRVHIYKQKIEKAFDKGLGLLFVAPDQPQRGLSQGRTATAISIAMSAIKEKHSAHYIEMNKYFELQRKQVRAHSDVIESFLDEINLVDFLVIDGVGRTGNTEFVQNNFRTLISDRNLQGLPTILVTDLNEAKIIEYLGMGIMDYIWSSMTKIIITSYTGSIDYLDIRKELS